MVVRNWEINEERVDVESHLSKETGTSLFIKLIDNATGITNYST